MAVVARAEYSTGRHRVALAVEHAGCRARHGHWLGVLQRRVDEVEEHALMQIQRNFVTAPQTRDVAFLERRLAKEYAQAADGKPVNVAAQLAELKAPLVQTD